MNRQNQITIKHICHPDENRDPVSYFNSKKESFTLDSRVRGNDMVIIVIFALYLISFFFISKFSYAETPLRNVRQQIRKEVIEDKKIEVKEKTQNILERAKEIIKEKIKKQIKGTLTSITGNVLTVQKDQTTFIVNTTSSTQFKRKFGGASSLGELSANDQLLIIGNRKNTTDGSLSNTIIDASYIRNMSIQRRFAVFTGEVTAKTNTILTINTVGRGVQTVFVSENTKYIEKNKTIGIADIQIGDKILVKGELWNRAAGKIDAQSILKLMVKK